MNLELVSELELLAEKIKPLDAFENFLNGFLEEKTKDSNTLFIEGVTKYRNFL